jgi:hypothetical protein
MASGISVKECVALVIWCFQCVGFQSLMPTFDTVPVVHMTVHTWAGKEIYAHKRTHTYSHLYEGGR